MTTLKIRVRFVEELLGTASANPEVYAEFLASKAPDGNGDEEIAALPVDEELEKQTTVFGRNGGAEPVLWDYQIKGFFKDACSMLRRVSSTGSSKLKAYKKEIDGLLFVSPRKIPLILPEGSELTFCQRPLRAQTAQGERVALARSEAAPAGTYFECELTALSDKVADLLEEWLDYGKLRGVGQWRNSGKGRFEWEEVSPA